MAKSQEPKARILLADDDDSVRTVLGPMLQLIGYHVDYACDGCDVVNLSANRSYDLILLDVHMRSMDGITATLFVRLREYQMGLRTPIIAATANTSEDCKARCSAAGVDRHLIKPINFKELVLLIEELLKGGQRPTTGNTSPGGPPQRLGPVPEFVQE